MCDFRVELPILAIATLLLGGLMPGNASGRHLMLISVCFLHFPFVLTALPLWLVSRSQDALFFAVD